MDKDNQKSRYPLSKIILILSIVLFLAFLFPSPNIYSWARGIREPAAREFWLSFIEPYYSFCQFNRQRIVNGFISGLFGSAPKWFARDILKMRLMADYPSAKAILSVFGMVIGRIFRIYALLSAELERISTSTTRKAIPQSILRIDRKTFPFGSFIRMKRTPTKILFAPFLQAFNMLIVKSNVVDRHFSGSFRI